MQCSRCIVFKILLLCLDLCLTIISLASPIYPHCLPTETLCTELFVADRQLSLSEGVYLNKRRGLNIKYKCQKMLNSHNLKSSHMNLRRSVFALLLIQRGGGGIILS